MLTGSRGGGCWRCGGCGLHYWCGSSNVLSLQPVSAVELLWEAVAVVLCGLMMGLG